MRSLKVFLVVMLSAVTVLFGITTLKNRLSGSAVAPEITCASELLELSVKDGKQALLSGVTAFDKQDGDLTDQIQVMGVSKLITDNTARVTYLVFDSDENMASATRLIRYTDYYRPTFAVTEPLVYYSSESITLLDRVKAYDAVDGDITRSIRVSSLSGADVAEIYTVTVQVTNSMGDTAVQKLPLILYSNTIQRPQIHLSSYLIYLEQGSAFQADDYLTGVSGGSADSVAITGTVDTDQPGTYFVCYRCPNSGGDGLSILTVVVEQGGQIYE